MNAPSTFSVAVFKSQELAGNGKGASDIIVGVALIKDGKILTSSGNCKVTRHNRIVMLDKESLEASKALYQTLVNSIGQDASILKQMERRNKLARKLLAKLIQVDGWAIEMNKGILHITNPLHETFKVDVSNPLKDKELVELHRRPDVPDGIKKQAEMMASQWRRVLHTTGEWENIRQQQ